MDTPSWFEKDISLGSMGHPVETVQLLLRLPKTGVLNEDTVRSIRGWQRLHGLTPRVWLTPAQREHSANFIGSPIQSRMAEGIRAVEQIGSDGMVRPLPGRSIDYQSALQMLGLNND